MTLGQRKRLLLTNDDGPPGPASPYLASFYDKLLALDWVDKVHVVIPSSQKSWIGTAQSASSITFGPALNDSLGFHITEITRGKYFYPTKASNGLEGEYSSTSRPLQGDEFAEWILLDGTPSTCVNVALHNLFPSQIDLVISGPNLGRNVGYAGFNKRTTDPSADIGYISLLHQFACIIFIRLPAAFALSSGTLGAALDAALAKTRAIAVSYGTVIHPTPPTFAPPAHQLACDIITRLVSDDSSFKSADLYNVNIPLVEGLLSDEGLKVAWTFMWRNHYGRLFKTVPANDGGPLSFKFAPSMDSLIQPAESDVPVGSDGYAMMKGWASITPLQASFSEPSDIHDMALEDRSWKVRL
ncbi:SurE domain-containing protein [Mycena indigotica]|uniref:SurE domain-containing protein n=1 Tax=Mycena indigotica TaxID=2126181 RepID=A0A8H6W5W2_9AGAR|nr:SurE domain-containing protein [Mycena indigotica]KAF7306944.1 SurE domain-containing protein [Mycena indigotica]